MFARVRCSRALLAQGAHAALWRGGRGSALSRARTAPACYSSGSSDISMPSTRVAPLRDCGAGDSPLETVAREGDVSVRGERFLALQSRFEFYSRLYSRAPTARIAALEAVAGWAYLLSKPDDALDAPYALPVCSLSDADAFSSDERVAELERKCEALSNLADVLRVVLVKVLTPELVGVVPGVRAIPTAEERSVAEKAAVMLKNVAAVGDFLSRQRLGEDDEAFARRVKPVDEAQRRALVRLHELEHLTEGELQDVYTVLELNFRRPVDLSEARRRELLDFVLGERVQKGWTTLTGVYHAYGWGGMPRFSHWSLAPRRHRFFPVSTTDAKSSLLVRNPRLYVPCATVRE